MPVPKHKFLYRTMNKKRVLCCQVDIPERYNFTDLILSSKYFKGKSIQYKDKKIELSHIKESEDVILGMFVTTQIKGIPPVHMPGNEGDYSAVDLGRGKGLAYPNVFLYHKEKQVLLWEENRLGVSESSMQYFFSEIFKGEDFVDFSINLLAVMSIDAYSRIKRLIRIDEVEFQIVNPISYLSRQASNNTLSSIADLAETFKASKAIKISMKAEEMTSINKSKVLSVAKFFQNITARDKGRMRNKFVIKGPLEEGGVAIEEAINFMTDRLYGYFDIDEPRIASHLNVDKRKDGVKKVYTELKSQLNTLLS